VGFHGDSKREGVILSDPEQAKRVEGESKNLWFACIWQDLSTTRTAFIPKNPLTFAAFETKTLHSGDNFVVRHSLLFARF
jgi:hypothetical protein